MCEVMGSGGRLESIGFGRPLVRIPLQPHPSTHRLLTNVATSGMSSEYIRMTTGPFVHTGMSHLRQEDQLAQVTDA